jgi:DNA-binding transcriptional LysR family regulator
VQLISDVLERCESLMLESKVQFVLSHAHPKAPGALDSEAYASARIGEDVLVAVSATGEGGEPRHRLGDGGANTVPILQYPEQSGLGRIIRAVVGRRLEALPAQIVFTAHLASVLRTMALDGRGIAWLPRTLVDDDLESGRLAPATGEEWNIPLEIRLYRDRESSDKAAEAFWSTAAGA